MEAAKAADFLALLKGNDGEQSDATQAYTQSKLGGTRTWVRLLVHRWPESWHGQFTDPVCPLELALYGHPDSGGTGRGIATPP